MIDPPTRFPRSCFRIVLGTAQFGMDYGIHNKTGKVSETDAGAILSEAASAGVNLIDTAPLYGNAEEVLGRLLKRTPEANFGIITKTTAPARDLRRGVEASMRMLGKHEKKLARL